MHFPNIREQFTDLGGNSLFSTIDLKISYHQILIAEKGTDGKLHLTVWGKILIQLSTIRYDKCTIYFSTPNGGNLKGVANIKIYVDDFLLYSKNVEDHLKLINQVLERLTKNNISINFSKCVFCQEKVKFLGNSIQNQGISPCLLDKEKIIKCLEP